MPQLRRSALPPARARFTKLLTRHAPIRIKAILEQQISGIDRQLAADRPDSSTAKP